MKRNHLLIKTVLYLVSCSLVLFLIGCATIMHGTKQEVGISSVPSSAKVVIDNRTFGNTPLVANLSRRKNHTVKILLDGYLPYELVLTQKVSGWIWGNIVFGVFGGLIGLVVDVVSGGIYKVTPEQIKAELKESGVNISLEKDRLYVAFVLTPNPEWEKVGQLTIIE